MQYADAVWTSSAVTLLDDVRRARTGDHEAMVRRPAAAYPWPTDDAFVAEHLDAWLS
ncbi:hypothetical protein ACFVW8_32685 [Streptomyces sp. NPDC058221]|uniref:hypothetical protein n=1 Tax=Streptomyces sp. NPDC058221 TaxID=3346388 RepID=UPI0036EB0772